MVAKASSKNKKSNGKKFDIKVTLTATINQEDYDDEDFILNDEETVLKFLESMGNGTAYSGTWELDLWYDDTKFDWDVTICEVGKKIVR